MSYALAIPHFMPSKESLKKGSRVRSLRKSKRRGRKHTFLASEILSFPKKIVEIRGRM